MTNDLSPDTPVSLDRALDQALGLGTAAGGWQLDPQKSSVEFRTRTMWGLVPVHGSFLSVEGDGQVESDGDVAGVLTIRADSLDTANAKRDAHLRGKDFFDVERHPSIVLSITGADRIGNARLRLSGDLQVLGNSRPVAFDAEVVALGGSAVQLRAELAVNRYDYGLSWNQLGMVTRKVVARVHANFNREGSEPV
jgi:polyisoprenoid-binding protein YceI